MKLLLIHKLFVLLVSLTNEVHATRYRLFLAAPNVTN